MADVRGCGDETVSFAEAARAQGRSPQAITRAVAALETRLGTRLLHRTTRSVSLTDEGSRYLERSRDLLAESDALESSPSARLELSGTLSVSAPVLFGQMHVLPVLTAFLAEHPAVDARSLLHDRIVSLAEEGVDVAVRIGELTDSALRVRVVGYVRSVICASPAPLTRRRTPRDPDDIGDHPCIAFTGTTPIPDRWTFSTSGRRDRVVRIRPEADREYGAGRDRRGGGRARTRARALVPSRGARCAGEAKARATRVRAPATTGSSRAAARRLIAHGSGVH